MPRKVIICPLDWGIGHTTRCVPVIRKFLEKGFEVIIAADGRGMEFLKGEFPSCRLIRFPGFKIRYPENDHMAMAILSQVPKMISGYFREHRFLKSLTREEKPDIILSDNRYGLWSKSVYCIFMTHQLDIRLPRKLTFLRPLLRWLLYLVINRYDECWIPDYELNQGLAGKLSHPEKLPPRTSYIGTLSRFRPLTTAEEAGKELFIDIMVILSGPEPQRTIFEEMLVRQLKNSNLMVVLVRGKPEEIAEESPGTNIRIFSHLETARMKEFMLHSGIIICRSGYSSIMDLVSLGKRAILVPTPGQTEQEYLAGILMVKKIFFSMPQKNFDLIYALGLSVNYPGIYLKNDEDILDKKIESLSSH